MRPIHLAHLDKTRPALVLTGELAGRGGKVVIADITSTVRGVASEVTVGRQNGLDHECVINCDNISTVPASSLGRMIGFLRDDQEAALAQAIVDAFDLHVEDLP